MVGSVHHNVSASVGIARTLLPLLYLFLQPRRSICFPFSIDEWQEHAKDAQQAVHFVLLQRCCALGRPTHSLLNTELAKGLSSQSGDRELGDLMDFLLQGRSGTQPLALIVEELDARRRQELLQCPTTGKPAAASKGFSPSCGKGFSVGDFVRYRHVRQVYVALGCKLVPAKYRVNRCAELITGRLVDTACIHPAVLEVVRCSSLAAEADLAIARLAFACAFYQLLVCNLLVVCSCVR